MLSGLAVAGVAPSQVGAASTFQAKCGTDAQTAHTLSVRAFEMFKAIDDETNGAVKIGFFPNSALGSGVAMLDQLRTGALEFQFCSGTAMGGIRPVTTIENVGFAFKDSKQALQALDGPLGDYIRKQLADAGLYTFPKTWDSGSLEITCSLRPIRTPDDVTGLKVRVPPSRVQQDIFTTLGATPATVAIADAYTAAQTHLVDGMSVTLGGTDTGHFYEVQKYLSLTNHSWSSFYFIANADMWSKAPSDVKAILERYAAKYGLLQRADNEAGDIALTTKLAQRGMVTNRPDQQPFRARLGPHYARWKAVFGDAPWSMLEKSVGKLG